MPIARSSIRTNRSTPATRSSDSFGGGINLGGLLGPLRQLSYWTMKKRARTIGEGGMHDFLKDLQNATAGNAARIHLMGHSFGTIVVSGMVGGPDARGALPRPVDSLVLVQGAVSLWCYARRHSVRRRRRWLLRPIARRRQGAWPDRDDAVEARRCGRHALSAGVALQGLAQLRAASFPNTARSARSGCRACPIVRAASSRCSSAGRPMSSSAARSTTSRLAIHRPQGGVSGAHSDIAGPEVAHAIWAAAFASA